ELGDILARDVRQRLELALGDTPNSPVGLLPRPRLLGACIGVLRVRARPVLDVRMGHQNQSAISRAADSGESEPCTRLSGIETARSPRIVPGAAFAGSVAPIVERIVAIAPSPSTTSAQVGPEEMKSTSSPKDGFSRC